MSGSNACRAVRGLVSALIGSLVVATMACAQDGAGKVTVTLHASETGPKISRHLFGQFAEHLGRGIYEGIWVGPDSPIPNTRGIRNDVVAALKALRVPNVRWPGGCFADEYHWRKGLGPASHRPATVNSNWGGVIEPNTFGTHEYMDFLQQIGADAYVSVNVGSGTVQEASDWMEYMTAGLPTALAAERAANGHPAPFKVPFVGIGNENWGCGGAMSPEYYVSQLKIYSHYVRSYDSAQPLQRIAVGSDGGKSDYTEAVMQAWQSHVYSWDIEGVSLHYYTVGKWPPSYKATGFGEGDYAALLQQALHLDDLIRSQGAIMDRYDPQKKIAQVVDEWGAWLAPTPGTNKGFLEQQNSQRDALIAALGINTLVRHADRVRMANIAQMINVLQAMIFTSGSKMVLTPTYHVFDLYQVHQDARLLSLKFNSPDYEFGKEKIPALNASASRDSLGVVHISLVNVDANRSLTVRTSLRDLPSNSIKGRILTSARVNDINTFDQPDKVHITAFNGARQEGGELVVTLPARSVVVLELK